MLKTVVVSETDRLIPVNFDSDSMLLVSGACADAFARRRVRPTARDRAARRARAPRYVGTDTELRLQRRDLRSPVRPESGYVQYDR